MHSNETIEKIITNYEATSKERRPGSKLETRPLNDMLRALVLSEIKTEELTTDLMEVLATKQPAVPKMELPEWRKKLSSMYSTMKK
jgi:hypothetical protein